MGDDEPAFTTTRGFTISLDTEYVEFFKSWSTLIQAVYQLSLISPKYASKPYTS